MLPSFSKYFSVARISWQAGLVYRLNFLMWRVRNIIQLLTIYFLWAAVSSGQEQIFTYSQSQILTYVLGSSIIRAVVLSSRSVDAQTEISSGDLNNQLLKPLNYLIYWASRDLADKILNIVFSIAEIAVLLFLLKPPVFLQSHPATLILFIASVIFGAILFFLFSFLISTTTFWYYHNNGWPQRFLSLVIIESLSGGLFPLDILPDFFASLTLSLPTAYFIYFPMQLYLGRLETTAIITGFAFMFFWILFLYKLVQHLWSKGLRVYAAFGR